jgi:hypothetical protein
MYVCTYVRVYVCIYIYVSMHVCMYVCMYIYISVIYIYMYACMYVCRSVCMYVCTYVYILLFCRGFRGLISSFETFVFFTVIGRQPLAQPPTWRTRVSLLVWIIPFDLSGLGDPTSSYATAGIDLRSFDPASPTITSK